VYSKVVKENRYKRLERILGRGAESGVESFEESNPLVILLRIVGRLPKAGHYRDRVASA
jgi:hypothetical protein